MVMTDMLKLPPLSSPYADAEFQQGVLRIKEYIAAGDVYQLVLSVRFAGLDIAAFNATALDALADDLNTPLALSRLSAIDDPATLRLRLGTLDGRTRELAVAAKGAADKAAFDAALLRLRAHHEPRFVREGDQRQVKGIQSWISRITFSPPATSVAPL